MKKLFKNSTLALVILSLFAVSCEKPDVAPAPKDEVKVTWTPENSSVPITTKGDIKDGEVRKDYTIEPKLAAPPCPDGTWGVTVEGPKDAQYVATYSAKTGKTNFHPLTKGTYKITFTYKCPGCKEVSITITITVS